MTDSLDRIAVVGMAGRYPGAQDLHQFWQNLKEGKLTDAQIQQELSSGNLEQKLRGLNPEAGPLLDDVFQAMRHHSNAEDFTQILNGLVGPVQ